MPFATLNGRAILSASITLPRVGVFVADVEVDSADPIVGAVELVVSDGALSFKGTILRGGIFAGKFTARIVGGAAGLGRLVEGKYYRGAPLRLPLQDLVDACGEKLSDGCDKALLGEVIPRWTRRKARAADCLVDLLALVGASFRILPDGTLWVGTETFPEQKFEHDLIADLPGDGRIVIASALPALRPGVTFREKRISAVQHTLAPESVRTTAWIEPPTEFALMGDRPKRALAMFVKNVAPLTFLKKHPGRVVLQEDDGTLHVQPDSQEIPGLTGVPIRYGVPGVRAKVPAGTRCTVEFEGSDPSKPVATAFEPGAIRELSFDGGTRRVAREGDRTDGGKLDFLVDPSGKTLTIVYTPPPPAAVQTLTLTFPAVGGAGSLSLGGRIVEGADRVRA